MKPKISIKKILVATIWFVIISGMMTLLVAANNEEETHTCKRVQITIKSDGESFYLDKYDVAYSLIYANHHRVVNQSLSKINLANLERILETNPWIKEAELYFDSQDVLRVTITERQPVARVFTKAGNSFYIDSSALRMPLLSGVSARVPVVTGFPASKRLNAEDSAQLNDVKQLVAFVRGSSFWNAQIAEIDITGNRKFELIPTIGDHTIRLGSVENLEQKFKRLFVFYQQVLSKAGFDKYSVLDVQYEGQVVAVHKGASSAVDSIQLQKNIEELMKRSLLQQNEEADKVSETVPQVPSTVVINNNTADTAAATPVAIKPEFVANEINTKKTTARPNPILKKPKKVSSAVVKTNKTRRKPKAVMPRRRIN